MKYRGGGKLGKGAKTGRQNEGINGERLAKKGILVDNATNADNLLRGLHVMMDHPWINGIVTDESEL